MWTSGRKGSSWIVVQRLHTDIFGGHDGRRLLLNHLLLLLSSFAFLTHFEVVAPQPIHLRVSLFGSDCSTLVINLLEEH